MKHTQIINNKNSFVDKEAPDNDTTAKIMKERYIINYEQNSINSNNNSIEKNNMNNNENNFMNNNENNNKNNYEINNMNNDANNNMNNNININMNNNVNNNINNNLDNNMNKNLTNINNNNIYNNTNNIGDNNICNNGNNINNNNMNNNMNNINNNNMNNNENNNNIYNNMNNINNNNIYYNKNNNINNNMNINMNNNNNINNINNNNMNYINMNINMNNNKNINNINNNNINNNNNMNNNMINKFKGMNLIKPNNYNYTMNNNNFMYLINAVNQMGYMNNYCINQNNINHQMNLNNINNYQGSENANIIGQNNSLKYPHKTGLQNVGQTCYMNSTIQCLSNIKYLSDYLIKHYGEYKEVDIKNKPLSVAFSSLVYDLFTTQQKNIAPNLFKKIIGKLNPLFEGNHAADAKDLIFFLLEKLHQELNKKDNSSEQSNIDYAQLEKDSFIEQKMLEHFIKDYTEKNRSIISDTFYGIIRSTMMCNTCKQIKYSFQTFNLLIFQLKNVKEYNQNTLKNNNNYKINIYDAFDCDKKEEILDGENMIYCNSCKGLNPGTHQQIIYSLPKVLIIILNRGRNNQDFNEEFIFPAELDLSIENYVVVNNNPDCNTHFYLQSVITHLGESGAGGHFIAYCRNGPKEDFFCYNDASVSKATVNDAMGSKISENVYEKRTPYILVYHHMN